MLLLLAEYLQQFHKGFAVFQYLTLRGILGVVRPSQQGAREPVSSRKQTHRQRLARGPVALMHGAHQVPVRANVAPLGKLQRRHFDLESLPCRVHPGPMGSVTEA